jgi:two-component system, NtrC family, sensor kinase
MFVAGLQALRAQVEELDSLFNQLVQTEQDSTKVLLLVELAGGYQFFDSDRAFELTDEALKLARKLRFTKGEVKAISRQGEVRRIRGELPQALEAELTAIQLSRIHDVPEAEAESLTFLATIYLDLGEYRKALEYLFQAKKIYGNIAGQLKTGVAQQFPPYVLTNIGQAYEKMNRLDSALYFNKLALNYPIRLIPQLQSDILVTIGIIERRQKKYEKALASFRQALVNTETSNDLLNRSRAQHQIATVLNLQNRQDSAIHYARLAFMSSEQSSSITYLLDAASLLAQLYKTKGNVDSAFYYLQAALNARDSLYGLDKFHKLQLLTLSEQQRLQQLKEEQVLSRARMQRTILLFSIGVFLLIAIVLWRSNRQKKKANHLLSDKNLQIERQSEKLKNTLKELKATQVQLIHQEKMASLGELTAGIAHEIQNPLNFVNNFSEVSTELLAELKEEIVKESKEDALAITEDLTQNLEKIHHHGRRADAIVKNMLQHSRATSGKKQLTNLNALAEEYLRLAYHGFRSQDNTFTCTLDTDFDGQLGKVEVVPQELGRVLLNLYNNAFYAVQQKAKLVLAGANGEEEAYTPTVTVITRQMEGQVEIRVRDNGVGMPESVKQKVFQPFFTTKPTGQGNGLGLSLSYDIITKGHGGSIQVESEEGEGSEFVIQLPINKTIAK